MPRMKKKETYGYKPSVSHTSKPMSKISSEGKVAKKSAKYMMKKKKK